MATAQFGEGYRDGHKKGYALGLTIGGALLMALGWYVGR